jgi:monoterpene epsilon-lactone hydrolase
MSIRAECVRLGLRWLKRRGRHESAEESRRRIDRMTSLAPKPPAGTLIGTVSAGGVPADLVSRPESQPERHVLFLHGGAYRAAAPKDYRHFTWRIAQAMRARVLAIDYRLAPEHPFPAALEDAVAAYRWLRGRGIDSRNILIVGDSAGGGLCFGLFLKLRDSGEALPAGLIALSPWTDLALTGASLRENAQSDPMLNADDLPRYAGEYLAGADPRLPYASPLYGDFTGCPATLLHVGSDEILRDDAVRISDRLKRAGGSVELQVWPRMPHAWHLFADILPEARRAIADMGRFAERLFAVSTQARDTGRSP